jgi:hypothetical protein
MESFAMPGVDDLVILAELHRDIGRQVAGENVFTLPYQRTLRERLDLPYLSGPALWQWREELASRTWGAATVAARFYNLWTNPITPKITPFACLMRVTCPSDIHGLPHDAYYPVNHRMWWDWWPPLGPGCTCVVGVITSAKARDLGVTAATAPIGRPAAPWRGPMGGPALRAPRPRSSRCDA